MKLVLLLLGTIYLINAQPAQERLELVEGDMLMTKEQKEIYNQLKTGRVRRDAVKDKWLWPKGKVYYTFRNLDSAGQDLAERAIKHWHAKVPCLKFIKRTNQKIYVQFQYDEARGACSSLVAYGSTTPRPINIGKRSKRCSHGSVIHEIGHAVGFFHEHARPDRDEKIRINWDNIREGVERNFNKASTKYVDSRGFKYDYGSIMHYSRYQGNNRPNAVVIQPKEANAEIGQRDGLSKGDSDQAKAMYKCNANDESELEYVPTPDDETDESGDKEGPKPGEVEE